MVQANDYLTSYLIRRKKVNISFSGPVFYWSIVKLFVTLKSIIIHSQLQCYGCTWHVFETTIRQYQILQWENMSKAQTAVFGQKLLSKLQQNCEHGKPCNCTTFSKPLQLLTITALETNCGAAVQNSSVVLLIQLYVAFRFTNLWTFEVFYTTHYYSFVCLTMHFIPTNHHQVQLTYI